MLQRAELEKSIEAAHKDAETKRAELIGLGIELSIAKQQQGKAALAGVGSVV